MLAIEKVDKGDLVYVARENRFEEVCFAALEKLDAERIGELARSSKWSDFSFPDVKAKALQLAKKPEPRYEPPKKPQPYCERCHQYVQTVTYRYDHSHGENEGEVHCKVCNHLIRYIPR